MNVGLNFKQSYVKENGYLANLWRSDLLMCPLCPKAMISVMRLEKPQFSLIRRTVFKKIDLLP